MLDSMTLKLLCNSEILFRKVEFLPSLRDIVMGLYS